jgi:hypothetical protein
MRATLPVYLVLRIPADRKNVAKRWQGRDSGLYRALHPRSVTPEVAGSSPVARAEGCGASDGFVLGRSRAEHASLPASSPSSLLALSASDFVALLGQDCSNTISACAARPPLAR